MIYWFKPTDWTDVIRLDWTDLTSRILRGGLGGGGINCLGDKNWLGWYKNIISPHMYLKNKIYLGLIFIGW
jgi:hypothetical protein